MGSEILVRGLYLLGGTLAAAIAVTCVSCGENATLEVRQRADVLAEPHPVDYPSSNPMPNSVIGTIEAGQEAVIIETVDGKDFRAYRVRTDKGVEGFVIHGPGVSSHDRR